MPVDVRTWIDIECPLEEVAAFAGDPDNVAAWYVNIQSVEWETPRPLAVGSRLAFVAHFLGRRLACTYEIIAHEPSVRMVMRTAQGPFPMETTYEWEAMSDTTTRMVLRNRGIPVGFSRLVAPFMAMAVRRANQKDLRRLKQILEAAG